MATRRVAIQHPIRQDNSFGEQTPTWTDSGFSLWADINPLSTNERIRGLQNATNVTHKVRVRFTRELKGYHRLVISGDDGERYLNIIGEPINENEENAFLMLLCAEHAK